MSTTPPTYTWADLKDGLTAKHYAYAPFWMIVARKWLPLLPNTYADFWDRRREIAEAILGAILLPVMPLIWLAVLPLKVREVAKRRKACRAHLAAKKGGGS